MSGPRTEMGQLAEELQLFEVEVAASRPSRARSRAGSDGRVSTTEVVRAYRETGSVWEAAKRLGLAGQTVHERLVSIGYPMRGRNWTDAESAELRTLAENNVPLSEVSRRLGRPFGSCASKASEMQLRFRRPGGEKPLPRGAGYDKANVLRHMRAIERYAGTPTQYARANSLHIDPLVKALERHCGDRWREYVRSHAKLPERECEYCGQVFIPNSGRQKCCTRQCAGRARDDRNYFGGRRREAIGLSAGVCQMCGEKRDHLAAHHVLGKENDPNNDWLVALCRGCHDIVTKVARRTFSATPEVWEALISLVWLRKNGDRIPLGTGDERWVVHTYVDIDFYVEDEDGGGYIPEGVEVPGTSRHG